MQDKMHTRAAEVLAALFKEMEQDPTLDELDAELRTAIHTLNHIEAHANACRPHGTPRLFLRPTGLLLQALTEQYYKDYAGDEVGA